MSSKFRKPYIYTPLSYPQEIRLVILHPDKSNRQFKTKDWDILIEIVHANSNECKYEALSYVWGVGPPAINIEVKGPESRKLAIGESLYGALARLRGTEGQRTLWIDALCIDQGNWSERSLQVRRMGDIFSKARSVIIWLGEAADDSNLAIKFIQNLSVGEFDRLTSDGKAGRALRAVAMLMRRPWFTRRWIVQEVAFAKVARVICGPNWIYWDTFSEGITLFVDKVDRMTNLFPPPQYRNVLYTCFAENMRGSYTIVAASSPFFLVSVMAEFSPTTRAFSALGGAALVVLSRFMIKSIPQQTFPIGEVRGVGAHALVMALDLVFRRGQSEDNPERLCTMEELLSYLTAFQASNAHDIIYALASLAKDPRGLVPDYNKSLPQVCKDVIEEAIKTSGSLNILCRPWAPNSPDLQSWIPKVSGLPLTIDPSHIYVRNCADTLVGLPNRRVYKACGSKLASAKFVDSGTKGLQNPTLSVLGFRLPDIKWLGDPAAGGTIPASWVALRVTMRDQFWRTMVANRDSNGNLPPSWYRRACEESCERCGNQSLDATALLGVSVADPYSKSSTIVSFLKRVQAVTWNRRLLILREGSLGLVPEQARVSDIVCILYGCDVPIVLRHHLDNFWEFIGEAYIHGKGVMDGDAVNKPHDEIYFNLK